MSAEFHALHHADRPLVLPNAWDHASAASLAAAGFRAIGTTSLGVAATNGLPDGAGSTRDETVALVRRLSALDCLLTVDIEGGFGAGPAGVAELVAALAEFGAVGINIEDGRSDGSLADPGRQAELVAAAKEGAPELYVNARVDTYWSIGSGEGQASVEATVERAHRYLEAGADGIFVPGVVPEPEIRELVGGIPAPLNLLYVPGRTTVGRLAELGVARVSTGSLLFRTALRAVVETANAVRDDGPVSDAVPSYAEVQRLR